MSFKTSIKMLGLAIFLLLSSALFGVQPKTVTVKIEYNGLSTDISTEINFEEEITVLEALMKVAKVQTHPIGEHVFVDAINDFENRKGEKA